MTRIYRIGSIVVLMFALLLLACFYCNTAFCYLDEYPPYRFKDGQPNHLNLETLVSLEQSEYKTEDSKVTLRLKETVDGIDFIIQDEGVTLVKMDIKEPPLPYAVYRYDIDGNGLNDFLVFYNYRGCGLSALSDKVEIYLKQNSGTYRKIFYDTISSGLEDFVDLNKDGKYEVIITGFYCGDKHNYFTYNIYEFCDYKLINADSKFEGFPKFIWHTNKDNDKDTKHLLDRERQGHTMKKNNLISQEGTIQAYK